MTSLKDVLPNESETVKGIYAHYKKMGDAKPTRGYLGASSIGHHCERYLWYQFRYCCKPEFDGRMYRLFETGELEEYRFEIDLENIGCAVHIRDQNGDQFEVSTLGGHFSGHMDGCAIGIPEASKTWHVLEFKTHNTKLFAKLKKEGVEKSFPKHYVQCQIYMHLTGMKRTLYLAKNKDTDELYSERIHYNKERAEGLIKKAEFIIETTAPPPRTSERSDYYLCKWCDARAICFGIQEEGKYQALPVPAISCRQCCHATPVTDNEAYTFACWHCEKHKRSLSEANQSKACEDHLCLPGLFAFAEPEEYGTYTGSTQEYIDFKNADGKIWQHGVGEGGFTTKELMQLSQQQLSIGMVSAAKELYKAEVTGVCHDDILLRYPVEDSEIVWHGRASQLEHVWKVTYCEDLSLLIPIATSDNFECRVAEYGGHDTDRVVIFWPDTKEAEIRKGKE